MGFFKKFVKAITTPSTIIAAVETVAVAVVRPEGGEVDVVIE